MVWNVPALVVHMCCMKYAEAKFLSLYSISFKEVKKNVSLNIKFRKAFKGIFADLVSEENFNRYVQKL